MYIICDPTKLLVYTFGIQFWHIIKLVCAGLQSFTCLKILLAYNKDDMYKTALFYLSENITGMILAYNED